MGSMSREAEMWGRKTRKKNVLPDTNASDHLSFPQIPKFTAPREIGKADGSGEGKEKT